ncbi:MAG: nickel pincer cofactor biosynthesis protein LarC [Acidobacteria bacterium]|nr:nickel pincer cofactor biosynthesis protein LarC [Acidobacteriota bacterium]
MSRVLFVDPFGGAAGDMLLAAMIDAGADVAAVGDVLAGLRLPGWRLAASRERHQGFAGVRVTVEVDQETNPARRLRDVEALLALATLPDRVRERSRAAFRRLFAAEADAHGVAVDEAHLHELAAVDAVVDIVGVCTAVELLGVDRVICGPIPVGRGTVQTAHGLLPVPGPAVAHLLRGVPLAAHAADGEMTTPTGATLLVTLVDEFSSLPAGTLGKVGVGLGTRKFAGLPNLLRVLVVETDDAPRLAGRPMVVVEAILDDVSGEFLGTMLEQLRAAGALDAWCLPGTGRKGRPVVELRALAEADRADGVAAALFAEGATLGVRLVRCTRPELERAVLRVATRFGEIQVKLGIFRGQVVSAKPEHDECVAAARTNGASVAAVVQAAVAAAPRIGSPHLPSAEA